MSKSTCQPWYLSFATLVLFEQPLVGIEFRGAGRGEVGQYQRLVLFLDDRTPLHRLGYQVGKPAQHGSSPVADRDGVLGVGGGIALLDACADDSQAFSERIEFVLGYRLQVFVVLLDAPLFPLILFARSEDGGHFGRQLAGCAVELGHHALHVLPLREIRRYLTHAAQALHGFALVVVAILVTAADGLELNELRSLLLVDCVCL